MGAFNTLISEAPCPHCGLTGLFEVQFKYGHTWQLRYAIGDAIAWGGNDVGVPGYRRVRVEAISGPCSHCGVDGLEFDIIVQDDRIQSLIPVGTSRDHENRDGYVVEQER
jgi:hypothetical protein